MTDKTAEIHLKQLTTALEFLAASWDNAAGELTRYPESRSKEDNIAWSEAVKREESMRKELRDFVDAYQRGQE